MSIYNDHRHTVDQVCSFSIFGNFEVNKNSIFGNFWQALLLTEVQNIAKK